MRVGVDTTIGVWFQGSVLFLRGLWDGEKTERVGDNVGTGEACGGVNIIETAMVLLSFASHKGICLTLIRG